jgi:hypothetical protein
MNELLNSQRGAGRKKQEAGHFLPPAVPVRPPRIHSLAPTRKHSTARKSTVQRVSLAAGHSHGRQASIHNPSNSGHTPSIHSHTTLNIQAAVPVTQEWELSPGRSLSGPQMNWQATYSSTRQISRPTASQRRKDAETPSPLRPSPSASLRLCVQTNRPEVTLRHPIITHTSAPAPPRAACPAARP